MAPNSGSRRRRRRWLFAGAEFDEASWTLRVGGAPVALEGKPLEVLHELLLRAGEVVTKDEILDAVWPGVMVVEGSLPTAISKLRKALGERENNIIETVPRVGYRLTASVRIESVDTPLAPRFTFVAGDYVPGRRQWQLVRALGDTGAQDVWLAAHEKTGETRVFKFADAPDRLRALKREATLSRVVFAGLGDRAPLPALLEWNFETSPFYLEYAYGGDDLVVWANAAGGLATIALEQRLSVAAQLARALATIHQLGVLHKDLKPANVLIAQSVKGFVIRLADFGSGRLVDDGLLDDFNITNPGLLDAGEGIGEPRSGTLAYRAPELMGDAAPTAKSDIFALGLILFQLVVGDFGKSLAPGWEALVADPLLVSDIRQAADGDPEKRIPSADLLADRIEQLEQRRADAAVAAHDAAEMAARQQAEARRQQRQPWIRAAVGSLVIGLLASVAFGAYAWSQRNRAVAAQELADTSYAFVAEDILGSADPARANTADETVADAMKRASMSIERRYQDQPGVAARLHLALARAFYGRADFDTARAELARGEALFGMAGEADSDDAVLGRLTLVHMNSVSGQPERLEEAGRSLEAERLSLGSRSTQGKVGFAFAQAEGAYGYMSDLSLAEGAFRRAIAIATRDPAAATPTQLLKAKSSLVLVLMRLGKPEIAEPMAQAVIAQSERVRGADHPDTLVTRQHRLNALSMLGRHESVVSESQPLLALMEQRLGAAHRFTLALRSTRFESFAALGQYEQAAREAEYVWQGASAQAGPQSHQALVGQTDYAAALCQTGKRVKGVALASDALRSARLTFGEDYPLTHAIRYFAAECLIANRDHTAAGLLLTGLDRQKIADLTGNPDIGGMVDLAMSEVALEQGDRNRATTSLRAAQAAFGQPKDPAIQKRFADLQSRLQRP